MSYSQILKRWQKSVEYLNIPKPEWFIPTSNLSKCEEYRIKFESYQKGEITLEKLIENASNRRFNAPFTSILSALYNKVPFKDVFKTAEKLNNKVKIINEINLKFSDKRLDIYKFFDYIDWNIDRLKSLNYKEAVELTIQFKSTLSNDFKDFYKISAILTSYLLPEEAYKYNIYLPCGYSRGSNLDRIATMDSFTRKNFESAKHRYLTSHASTIAQKKSVESELNNKWSRLLIFMTIQCFEKKICLQEMLAKYRADDFVALFCEFYKTRVETKNEYVRCNKKLHPAKRFFCSLRSLLRNLDPGIVSHIREINGLNFEVDVAIYLPNKRIPAADREIFTDEELLKLTQVAKLDPYDDLFIIILKEIALRTGAMARLTYSVFFDSDFKPKHDSFVIEKSNKVRTLIFNSAIINKLHALPQPFKLDDLIFCNPETKFPEHSIRSRFRRLAELADIPVSKRYPHLFRHTLVTKMMNKGIKSEIITSYIGHSRMDTTLEDYRKIDFDELKTETINNHNKQINFMKLIDLFENCLKSIKKNPESIHDIILSYDKTLNKIKTAVLIPEDCLTLKPANLMQHVASYCLKVLSIDDLIEIKDLTYELLQELNVFIN